MSRPRVGFCRTYRVQGKKQLRSATKRTLCGTARSLSPTAEVATNSNQMRVTNSCRNHVIAKRGNNSQSALICMSTSPHTTSKTSESNDKNYPGSMLYLQKPAQVNRDALLNMYEFTCVLNVSISMCMHKIFISRSNGACQHISFLHRCSKFIRCSPDAAEQRFQYYRTNWSRSCTWIDATIIMIKMVSVIKCVKVQICITNHFATVQGVQWGCYELPPKIAWHLAGSLLSNHYSFKCPTNESCHNNVFVISRAPLG